MIYLDLFYGFLRVGCFAFGGAYGAIPLIRDVVLSYGWLNEETLAYMIAVSESTPGPIMVNLATYIGTSQDGFLGAVIATLAVVLPSFAVILAVTAIMSKFLRSPYVQAIMGGLKPCLAGVILATGLCMILSNCVPFWGAQLDVHSLIITFLLAAVIIFSKKVLTKKLSSVSIILVSALIGSIVYCF